MNNAKIAGFKKGIWFNLGIFAGFFIVMVLCLAFASVLYSLVPKIQVPMKIAGAAYMAYLIVKTLFPPQERGMKNSSGSFMAGALLQLINPKIMIYGITAMSSYILPHFRGMPTLLLFAFLLSFVGFTGTLCWALFGSLFKMAFSKHGAIINIAMAALLLYCIVGLFV